VKEGENGADNCDDQAAAVNRTSGTKERAKRGLHRLQG
jgi:hypothetical protein